MKQLAILSILVLFALGCKTTKQASDGKLADPSLARLNVSFISIGSGINTDAVKTYDKFIADYEKNHSVDIQFDLIRWGREGEVDYCFKLTELKEKAKVEFVTETQKVLKGKEHVIISENFKCRENRF